MRFAVAAIAGFGILTLWIPAEWPVAVFEIGVFLLLAISICQPRRGLPEFVYPVVPLAAVVGVGLFQAIAGRTVYVFDTKQAIVRWLAFLAVLLVTQVSARNATQLSWLQSAMLWFGASVALVAILQAFTADGRIFWLFRVPYSERAMGPILYYNHFAAFVELVFPLAIYRSLRSERRQLLYSGAVACLYASVIVSTSRAGTILCTAMLGVVPLLMYWRGKLDGRRAAGALLRVVAFLALFTVVVGWETVWNRLQMPDPLAFRREVDVSSLHIVADHPWLGTGMGTWPVAYPKYATFDAGVYVNQAHCEWLQWAAEGGIPLAGLMVGLFAWCAWRAWNAAWGLGTCFVLIHALVDYPFSRPALGSWFMLMVALLAAGATQRAASGESGDRFQLPAREAPELS